MTLTSECHVLSYPAGRHLEIKINAENKFVNICEVLVSTCSINTERLGLSHSGQGRLSGD